MTACRLILRSLAYFRLAHGALLAGMILVTVVLTGALILGDSVRRSLRDLAGRRRGGYETLITANGFFSDTLADRIKAHAGISCAGGLALSGRARAQRTALSAGAQLLAIPAAAAVPPGHAWITRTLADSLEISPGDTLLITLPGAAGMSDSVLARRDRTGLGSVRITVERILDDRSRSQPDAFLAWFDLHPSQRPPANIWLNLADLQEALLGDIPPGSRIPASPANLILASAALQPASGKPAFLLPQSMTLEDYGLGLVPSADQFIVNSGNIYIPQRIARALHPLTTTGQAVYTLLLDQVAVENPGIPPLNYVVAAGIEGGGDLALNPAEAAVNQWTADQLHLKTGDTLRITPYRIQDDGTVAVADATTVKVARIIPLSGLGSDPTLTPSFHGLTDAASVSDWNPPPGFPFDRQRVTPADETYWHDHKAAPKLLLDLATAQKLGKHITSPALPGGSAGELTSLRIPGKGADQIKGEILRALTPADAGFASRPFAPLQMPSTDFAGLFLGLSGFLLISALLLVVLLFRLAVEQRSRQIGLLVALGYTPMRTARLILAEGTLIALAGTLAGLPVAAFYTRLLLAGLGTWWIGATGTQAIELHIHPPLLAI